MKIDFVTRYMARVFLPIEVTAMRASTIDSFAKLIGAESMAHVAYAQSAKQGFAIVGDAGTFVALAGTDALLEYRAAREVSPPRLSDFLENAGSVAELVLGLLARKAVRLAVVSESLMPELSTDQMNAIARSLLHFPPELATPHGAPWEWDWRCVASREHRIGERTESVNSIATIKRCAGVLEGKPIDRINVAYDVNTDAKNVAERIAAADARAFFRVALESIEALERGVSEQIDRGAHAH